MEDGGLAGEIKGECSKNNFASYAIVGNSRYDLRFTTINSKETKWGVGTKMRKNVRKGEYWKVKLFISKSGILRERDEGKRKMEKRKTKKNEVLW